MKTFRYIWFVLLGWQSSLHAQQDPQYSQYMLNQLVINPAYSGTKDAVCAVMDLRKQWLSMPGAPQTGTMSMHGSLGNGLGIGGHLITESIGPTSWTSAYVDLAYHFRLGKGKLSLGFSSGLVNYNIHVSQLDFKDGGEPILGYTGAQTRFDASMGLHYYTESFYAGASLSHLTSPNLYNTTGTVFVSPTLQKNVSLFFSLQPHSFIYGGKAFKLNENLTINPSVMIKTIQGNAPSLDLNCNFLIRSTLWLGISLRSGYGLVGLMQLQVAKQFKIAYAYDLGLNKIGIAGQSTHEIVLSYSFHMVKTTMLSPRYL